MLIKVANDLKAFATVQDLSIHPDLTKIGRWRELGFLAVHIILDSHMSKPAERAIHRQSRLKASLTDAKWSLGLSWGGQQGGKEKGQKFPGVTVSRFWSIKDTSFGGCSFLTSLLRRAS